MFYWEKSVCKCVFKCFNVLKRVFNTEKNILEQKVMRLVSPDDPSNFETTLNIQSIVALKLKFDFSAYENLHWFVKSWMWD